MPEHPHIGRCVLVAVVAVLAAAAAQAAPKDNPGKDAGAKDASPAISLDQLAGTWKNAKSGVIVRIEQGAAKWGVWFSTSGEARITLPEKNRPAIKIDGRNFTCSYSVTLPTARTMKWDLTQGQPEARCPTGVFTRLEPAPSEVKPAVPLPQGKSAAKIEPAPVKPSPEVRKPPEPAAKTEPASVKPSPEVKKPPEPAAVVEPTPASRTRPLWAPHRVEPRHAVAYRRPPVRLAIRHRFWRIAGAPPPYAAGRYRPYRHFHHWYRWYVVLVPRCDCR